MRLGGVLSGEAQKDLLGIPIEQWGEVCIDVKDNFRIVLNTSV